MRAPRLRAGTVAPAGNGGGKRLDPAPSGAGLWGWGPAEHHPPARYMLKHNPTEGSPPAQPRTPAPTSASRRPLPPGSFPSFLVFCVHTYSVRFGGGLKRGVLLRGTGEGGTSVGWGPPLPGKGLSAQYHWSAAPRSIQEVFLVADARPARTPALWVMLCPSTDLAWSLGGIQHHGGVPKSGVWVQGGLWQRETEAWRRRWGVTPGTQQVRGCSGVTPSQPPKARCTLTLTHSPHHSPILTPP